MATANVEATCANWSLPTMVATTENSGLFLKELHPQGSVNHPVTGSNPMGELLLQAMNSSTKGEVTGQWIELTRTVDALAFLQTDWDGEGAPSPVAHTLEEARKVISFATRSRTAISSIDPDVLGGIGVYLDGVNGAHVWINLRNDGAHCALFDVPGAQTKATAIKYSAETTLPVIQQFLAGKHDATL